MHCASPWGDSSCSFAKALSRAQNGLCNKCCSVAVLMPKIGQICKGIQHTFMIKSVKLGLDHVHKHSHHSGTRCICWPSLLLQTIHGIPCQSMSAEAKGRAFCLATSRLKTLCKAASMQQVFFHHEQQQQVPPAEGTYQLSRPVSGHRNRV